jgi:O-methyltransferase involved in polyketide biosynthesis
MKHLSPTASEEGAHDFDSISPSAYALLLMKGLTPIPYAHEAAALLQAIEPSAFEAFSAQADLIELQKQTPGFWARVLHFENRYFSIDQLLSDLTTTNILELSSGFSFRGLTLSHQRPVFYIDTDLPTLIATKRRFIDALTAEPSAQAPTSQTPAHPSILPGHYELQPLNALDTTAFDTIVDGFPPGELTIVNEGLLVYLNPSEKEKLCRNIRTTLQQRGGCWITGDIYIKSPNASLFGEKNDAFLKFLEQHNIEANKFESFDDARDFFARMGFTLDREANVDFTTLSALPNLLAACSPEQLERLRQAGRARIHAIWRLRPA